MLKVVEVTETGMREQHQNTKTNVKNVKNVGSVNFGDVLVEVIEENEKPLYDLR